MARHSRTCTKQQILGGYMHSTGACSRFYTVKIYSIIAYRYRDHRVSDFGSKGSILVLQVIVTLACLILSNDQR